MRQWVSMIIAVLILGTAQGAQTAKVGLIKIDGAIGPATASYIARAIGWAFLCRQAAPR